MKHPNRPTDEGRWRKVEDDEENFGYKFYLVRAYRTRQDLYSSVLYVTIWSFIFDIFHLLSISLNNSIFAQQFYIIAGITRLQFSIWHQKKIGYI